MSHRNTQPSSTFIDRTAADAGALRRRGIALLRLDLVLLLGNGGAG